MNNHEVNLEGRRLVIEELQSHGAFLDSPDRTKKGHLCATNSNNSRTVELKVKVKRRGNWHTRTEEGIVIDNPLRHDDVRSFWVLLDLGVKTRYWIVPEGEIRKIINKTHQDHLNKHGGHRPKNDNSNHCAIYERDLKEEWQNNWKSLGIF